MQERIGLQFCCPQYLERAVTHRSFVHEQTTEVLMHNESLEFLGDSILGFVISEELFRRYPEAQEGTLSKAKAYLVSAPNLYRQAKILDLGYYLRLSFGEEKTGGRKKRALLVDAYEALIAAIYLDAGIDRTRQFICRQFQQALDEIDLDRVRYSDYKSTLQEKIHLLHLPEPIYEVVEEEGPDHAKTFVVELRVGGILTRAKGLTKKEAQQNAARRALERLPVTNVTQTGG